MWGFSPGIGSLKDSRTIGGTILLPISICIIAKNEQKYLEECLQRLLCLSCEILVVDTGSTDQTISIAEKYATSVYSFPWCNDFSAARNYASSKASNNWVLHVDCDEFLETQETYQLFSSILDSLSHETPGYITRYSTFFVGTTESASLVKDKALRFFHKDYYHYTGTIHEQVTAINNQPIDSVFTLPLVFHHKGYIDLETRLYKATRNIELLEKDLNLSGPDPYTYFQLGQSYFAIQDIQQALYYYNLGLSMDLDPSLPYVHIMVESYGYCLLEIKEYKLALQLETVYNTFSHYADFVFLMGLIYMNNARFQDAIKEFEKAVTIPSYSVEGVNSYSSYFNIGVIYECMGDKNNAKIFYSKCGDYEPAKQRLHILEQ